MNYQAVYFPDPYDIGVREVQFASTAEELQAAVIERFSQSGRCAYGMYEKTENGWKALPRRYYFEINKRLGMF